METQRVGERERESKGFSFLFVSHFLVMGLVWSAVVAVVVVVEGLQEFWLILLHTAQTRLVVPLLSYYPFLVSSWMHSSSTLTLSTVCLTLFNTLKVIITPPHPNNKCYIEIMTQTTRWPELDRILNENLYMKVKYVNRK